MPLTPFIPFCFVTLILSAKPVFLSHLHLFIPGLQLSYFQDFHQHHHLHLHHLVLTHISLVRGCALISYFLSSSSLTSSLTYFIWVSLCQDVFGAELFIRGLEGNQRDWFRGRASVCVRVCARTHVHACV